MTTHEHKSEMIASVFIDPTPEQMAYSYKKTSTPFQVLPSYSEWRDRGIDISQTFNNSNFTSENQKLVGNANPRTKIAPIIPNPICDSEFWRANDFAVPSGINDQKTRELFQSGYIIDLENCSTLKQIPAICDTTPVSFECELGLQDAGCKKFEHEPPNIDSRSSESCNKVCLGDTDFSPHYHFKENEFHHDHDHSQDNQHDQDNQHVRENYANCQGEYHETKNDYIRDHNTITRYEDNLEEKKNLIQYHQQNGDMITPMGYDASQLELHNIPSNLAVGDCVKNNVFNEYNKEIYTSLIQPGVYTRNEIIEPVDSNIGISFTQQFEPSTCSIDKDGNTEFIQHDPRLINKDPSVEYEFKEEPNRSNVYDPRFTGYGTSYRTYIEPVTGQVRFYYDDVDAIRKYNYITRNKLDWTDFGQQTGPMRKREFEDICEIRKKAQLTFANETIKQRTELQERLMRKMNANSWQRKQFPIHTRQMPFTVSSTTTARGFAGLAAAPIGGGGGVSGGFMSQNIGTVNANFGGSGGGLVS